MPSPLGHALAAVAVGWAVAPARPAGMAWRRQAAIFAAIGMAPDLDLLIGRHSAETHSVGAAVLVACLAAWRRWPVAPDRWRIWLAVCLAWASHPLLDALAPDTSPPIGIMAFWPISREYVQAGVYLFAAISRRWWLDGFLLHNTLAVLREVLILVPVAVLVWIGRVRRVAHRRARGAGSYRSG